MAAPQQRDFDDVLKGIAEDVTNESHIDNLGKALGFRQGPISNYIKGNYRFGDVTSQGTLKMLRDWSQEAGRSRQEEKLRDALIKAKLQGVADDWLPLYGSGAPLPVQSSETEEDPSLYVTEKQMLHIASNLLSDFYMPLCNALGFEYAVYENTKRRYLLDIKQAMMEMLHEWKRKTGGKCSDLDAALQQAECTRLSYTYKEV